MIKYLQNGSLQQVLIVVHFPQYFNQVAKMRDLASPRPSAMM